MDLLLFLIILSMLFCIRRLYLYKQKEQLHYLVAWSTNTYFSSAQSVRNGLDLIDYIYRAQKNLNIPTDYCFTKQSELDIVDLLLEEYQRSLAQKFFNHNLNPPRFKKRLSGEQYFMYMLCLMLKQHQCDSQYIGNDMHTKNLKYKEYGSWGYAHYDSTYSITDFAVTYHKLYYAVHLFCQKDPILNQNNDFYNSDSIKEIIDTRQISISCY